jgi:hypothetical protein
VAPLSKDYYFPEAAKASVDLVITGTDGSNLYLLRCRTFGAKDDPEFDYSGDFECRLSSLYSTDRYSTLLTENPGQTRDWESRARFFAEELRGSCAKYPEYGRVRMFRLRGMKLTLRLGDVQFRRGKRPADPSKTETLLLSAFRLRVEVGPAPDVKTEIAEEVSFEQPPLIQTGNLGDLSRDCRRVIRRNKQQRKSPH